MLISILLSFNVFGLCDYLENSNLYYRFLNKSSDEFFSSGRFELKQAYFQNFTDALFGGSKLKTISGKYAHDLFLDTYDEAGIFALVAVTAFIFRSLWVFFKCLKNIFLDINIKLVILSTYISFYLQFLIEPILQGVPWLFMLFCVVHGMLESFYSDIKSKNCVTDT